MKKAKRFLSVLLVLCMVLGMIPGTVLAAKSSMPFTDVKESDWFYEAVQYVYENGMMSGTGETSFSPNATTTRGMIVTILHRMEGAPSVLGEEFTDVSEGQYYTDAVAWASANGIVGGYGNGMFGPNDPITREQTATILYRYVQYKGYDASISGEVSSFVDGDQVNSYAVDAMNWAVGTGLISGAGNNKLSPADSATRAQVATILTRFCNAVVPAVYTVSFDYNYGDRGVYQTVTVLDGETVIKPVDPVRNGYYFAGWYTEDDVKFEFDTAVTADITLYAKWNEAFVIVPDPLPTFNPTPSAPVVYTVTFDYNYDNQGAYQTVNVLAFGMVSAPAVPTREGYSFVGWYTAADGGAVFDFDTIVIADFTLYAKWEENVVVVPEPEEYTVTFEYNYDEMGVYQTVTVLDGETVGEPAAPTREGYSFVGWYTAADGGAEFDFDTAVTADITLYAKWDEDIAVGPVYYTVSFETNGGSEVEAQIVEAGNTAIMPNVPTKESCTFVAWYSDAELMIVYDFSLPVTNDITLYAKWDGVEVEVDSTVTGSAAGVDVFSISDLRIDKQTGVSAATVSAPENCALVIRFIEEEIYFSENYPLNKEYIAGGSVFASHVVRAGTDMEEITAVILGSLPEYYVAEAVLLDGNGNMLCDPFASIEHTQRYEQFQQKTVYDFEDDEVVLNFDQATDNNFGVLADDVKIFNIQDLVIDETSGIYYLTGVSEPIGEGDKLFINDGTDQTLIRVETVSEVSGVIQVVPADADDEAYGYTLEDFYKFIKVDMVYDGELETEDTYVNSVNPEYAQMAMSLNVIDTDVSAETTLSVNPITFETEHFVATGKVGGKISANLVMEWDVVLFGKDYMRCDFTYSTDLNANITVAAKWEDPEGDNPERCEKEFKLGKVRIPFGVTGLDAFADIKANVKWKITAGLELTGTIKTTHGFKYNTKTGSQKIDKKENTWSINCKGHAEISFGPSPSVGVEFLNGVISCELECFFGAKAEANAVVPLHQGGVFENATSKHSCYLCIDGNVKMVISVDAKLKYKITDHLKGTPIDWNIITVERNLFDFYISLLNAADSMFGGRIKFGTGSCPNEAFRTEFLVYNANGELCDATVNVSRKSTGAAIATAAAGESVYLYEGNYVAATEIGSSTVSRTFTVSDEAQVIKLTQATCDGSVSGVVREAVGHTGIANATVSIYKGGVLCASTKTGADGSYRISLAEGTYKYEISAVNFVSVTGYITINDGETKYMEATLMAGDNDEVIMGGVYGTIKDAQTGLPLSGVKVQIYCGANNITDAEPATDRIDVTDTYGEYSYRMWSVFGVSFGLPAGNYTVVLSKDGYITTSFNIVVVAGVDTEFNGSISPVTADNEYRVVLTWGQTPRDLDSHYVAVTSDGYVDHVYYRQMNSTSAELDTDDTTSFGPETVYINGFEYLENGFSYCIHDYTNRSSGSSHALSNSGATVRLYRGATLIATYYVPTGQGGTVWNVFSISGDGTVTPINTMSYESSPSYVGMNLIERGTDLYVDGEQQLGQESIVDLKDYELLLQEV